MLMGNTGFRVLLSRALQMARETDDWLHAVEVTADGSLEMLNGSQSSADRQAMDQASLSVVSRLLTLLAAFIGEELTLRIVHEAWPKLPPGHPDSGKGKTK